MNNPLHHLTEFTLGLHSAHIICCNIMTYSRNSSYLSPKFNYLFFEISGNIKNQFHTIFQLVYHFINILCWRPWWLYCVQLTPILSPFTPSALHPWCFPLSYWFFPLSYWCFPLSYWCFPLSYWCFPLSYFIHLYSEFYCICMTSLRIIQFELSSSNIKHS